MSPTLQFAYKGKNVKFICHSINKVKWYKDGTEKKGKLNNTLLIEDVKRKHTGRYKCRGVMPNGESFSAHGDLYVGGTLSYSINTLN